MRDLVRRRPSLMDDIFGSIESWHSHPTNHWWPTMDAFSSRFSSYEDETTYTLEIDVPSNIDVNTIKAELEGNTLRLSIPKPQREVKKIEVQPVVEGTTTEDKPSS